MNSFAQKNTLCARSRQLRRPLHLCGCRSQRGIVLMIALIVLVAMALAGIALIRSVDTTTGVSGNVSFKQGALQEADVGIETGIALLEPTGALAISAAKPETPDPIYRYYATAQATDARGIPTQLVNMTANDAFIAGPIDFKNNTTGNRVRILIDRLCNADGPFDSGKCTAYVAPREGPKDAFSLGNLGGELPYYRISVRVDGPKNTVGFSQMIVHM
jgi:Tfp pilus assembly protein PilX